MTGTQQLGPLIHSFFLDHLVTIKGLRPASVRSYSDTIRLLLLCFMAQQQGTKITKLTLEDLIFEHILGFLRYLGSDSHTTRRPATNAWPPCSPFSTTSPPGNDDARNRPTDIGHPHETGGTCRDAFLECYEMQTLLRHLPHRPPRPAGPRPHPVPLQHRGAGTGSR